MARQYEDADDLLDALREGYEDEELVEILFTRLPFDQLKSIFKDEIATLDDDTFGGEDEEDADEDNWLSADGGSEEED